jgi:hypothetical protein
VSVREAENSPGQLKGLECLVISKHRQLFRCSQAFNFGRMADGSACPPGSTFKISGQLIVVLPGARTLVSSRLIGPFVAEWSKFVVKGQDEHHCPPRQWPQGRTIGLQLISEWSGPETLWKRLDGFFLAPCSPYVWVCLSIEPG